MPSIAGRVDNSPGMLESLVAVISEDILARRARNASRVPVLMSLRNDSGGSARGARFEMNVRADGSFHCGPEPNYDGMMPVRDAQALVQWLMDWAGAAGRGERDDTDAAWVVEFNGSRPEVRDVSVAADGVAAALRHVGDLPEACDLSPLR
jgi:hypothetical protein